MYDFIESILKQLSLKWKAEMKTSSSRLNNVDDIIIQLNYG
jgi:hypothetical protein